MTAKAHYDNFLSGLYSRMTGDYNERSAAFEAFLERRGLLPKNGGAMRQTSLFSSMY